MLKCGNRSMEVRTKATYPCSVPYWHTLCVLRPCSQKVTLLLQCESRILGCKTAASVTIDITMPCDSWTQTKPTNIEWANDVGFLAVMQHSSSPRILDNGSNSYVITPETLAKSHHSLGMRPWQDYTSLHYLWLYTHRVMLTTVLVVTGAWCISVWLSHCLETVTHWLQGTVMSQ